MLTYEDARPWALAMKQMVVTRAMPPWFEDGHTEKFENNRSLTQAQIDTIAAWVGCGRAQGRPKDLPPPIDFVNGWTIPKPDKVYQLPRPFPVPATGILEYQYVILPTGFTKDTWVQDVEAAPTDRSVVHHIVAYVRKPGSNYFKGQPKEEFFEAPPAKTGEKAAKDDVPNDWLVGYAPGQPPDMFEPGQAKLIPAGSDIVLEVHYMPEGKATTDQANVGLVLAKEPPKDRVMTLSTGNEKFKIPPGRSELPRGCLLHLAPRSDAAGYASPHAYARQRHVVPAGVSQRRDARHPERAALQLALAALVQPGQADCAARGHAGSSARRTTITRRRTRKILIPAKTVTWGQQSFDEMMVCFFNVAFPADTPSKDLLPLPENETASRTP